MDIKIVCCYKVFVVDKYGFERYFHVRMSYLPTFIKRFVKNGSILTITGRVQEEVYSEARFHSFIFSEYSPF